MALKKYLRRHRRRYRSLPPLPSTDEIEEAASKTPFGKAGGTIRSYLSLPFTMEDFSVRKSILSATEEAFFRTRTLWEEFMEFIDQGNALELAVGIILASVFTKVVDSLVQDMLLPPLGLVTGSNLANNFVIIRQPKHPPPTSDITPKPPTDNGTHLGETIIMLLYSGIPNLFPNTSTPYNTPEQAQQAGAVTLNYGRFIQTVINFFLVSLAMFIFIRIFQLVQRDKIYNKTTRCRFCWQTIPKRALRCHFCTSFLDGREEVETEYWQQYLASRKNLPSTPGPSKSPSLHNHSNTNH